MGYTLLPEIRAGRNSLRRLQAKAREKGSYTTR